MALKDLLTALEADAAAETERLHGETEAEAARIVESAQLEARTVEQEAARADEAEFARELERRRSEARLAAAGTLRDAHEASVEQLRGALLRRLASLRATDAYPGVFRALIEEALAAVPSVSLLRVDARDAQLAREIIRELNVQLELAADLDTLGGVEAVASDGRTARNTIEERLRNAEPALRVLAGEVLGTEQAPS